MQPENLVGRDLPECSPESRHSIAQLPANVRQIESGYRQPSVIPTPLKPIMIQSALKS